MKIICIGRNYMDHAKELGNEIPSEPVFFIKPDTALLRNNQDFFIPDFSNDVQYEVELVLKINKVGKNIQEKFAHKYYDQIFLGIDFTARDVQNELKAKGLPWEKAKSFDYSAVISKESVNKINLPNLDKIQFSLYKNNELAQAGCSEEMLFKFDAIIAHVSKYITLKTGDYIYTGTPKGVGKVSIGDTLVGKLKDEVMFDFEIK